MSSTIGGDSTTTTGLIREDVGVPTMPIARAVKLMARVQEWGDAYAAAWRELRGIGAPDVTAVADCLTLDQLIASLPEGWRLVVDDGWPIKFQSNDPGDGEDVWRDVFAENWRCMNAVTVLQTEIDVGNPVPENNPVWFTNLGRWMFAAMWIIGMWRERLQIEGKGVIPVEG